MFFCCCFVFVFVFVLFVCLLFFCGGKNNAPRKLFLSSFTTLENAISFRWTTQSIKGMWNEVSLRTSPSKNST